MYAIVKDFFFNLSDMDFLSMLEGIDFYSKRISVKKHYWQTLFNTLSQFIHLRNKTEKAVLANAMKELTYWRLGSVSSTSYKKYFLQKLHSNHSKIIRNLKHLRDQLRQHLGHVGFVNKNKNKVNKNVSKDNNKGKKVNIQPSEDIKSSTASRAARQFMKDNIIVSTFLHKIETHFNKRGFIYDGESERSEYRPPTIDESLGTLVFDNFSEEKFIHEISHLLHYNFNFHNYNCPSLDDEHHDKLFWKIVELVTDAFQSHDVENLLIDISSIRPWNVDDLPTSTMFPPTDDENVSDGSGFLDRNDDFDKEEGEFDPGYLGNQDSAGVFNYDEGPKIYELGYENYREGFGYNPNPFDDPVED